MNIIDRIIWWAWSRRLRYRGYRYAHFVTDADGNMLSITVSNDEQHIKDMEDEK